MAASAKNTVERLVRESGQTYAEEAGIKLRNAPAPLYQLLVLATLLSAPISSGVAVAAARELVAAGMGTPRAMADADWQARVDALGRGHYRRYDESAATALGKSAQHCLDRWRGDLRLMRREADGDVRRLAQFVQEFDRVGPTGSNIFIREVQSVWPEFAPFVDSRVAAKAGALHLPTAAEELADLVAPDQFARLTAALIRSSARPSKRVQSGDR